MCGFARYFYTNGGLFLEFKVNSGIWGTMFGIPCVVADNFLKLADEAQIKVLLYLMRNSGKSVTTEEISANSGVPVQAVNDAVLFWQQVNVLSQDISLSSNTYETAQIISGDTAPTAQPVAAPPSPTITPPPKSTSLHPSEIAEIVCNNPNIAELFKISETLLGPLNPSTQNSLIWMFNYLGLKKEVILILINYCVEANKTSNKYIEKIAMEWAEKEIDSLEAATLEIEQLNASRLFTGEIKRIFELRQNPTTNQQKFISQWQKDGISIDLIHLAYEKTVEQINKVSFEYINKILVSWKNSGYTSPDDVKKAEEEYKKKKNTPDSASSDGFDADKYKMVINNI